MVTIEQVRLLETKVSRAVDYVKKLTDENNLINGKLDSYRKRIDELEVLIQRFKDDQSHIEEGIISALNRLNQFESDMDKSVAAAKQEASREDAVAQNTSTVTLTPQVDPEAVDEAIDEDEDGDTDEEALWAKADEPDTEMSVEESLDDAQLLDLSDAAGKPGDGKDLDIY
jgi:chromosome segregation ATPase